MGSRGPSIITLLVINGPEIHSPVYLWPKLIVQFFIFGQKFIVQFYLWPKLIVLLSQWLYLCVACGYAVVRCVTYIMVCCVFVYAV